MSEIRQRPRSGPAEPDVTELLNDPIAAALMRADGVEPHEVMVILQRIIADRGGRKTAPYAMFSARRRCAQGQSRWAAAPAL